jgi:hypothetical protein
MTTQEQPALGECLTPYPGLPVLRLEDANLASPPSPQHRETYAILRTREGREISVGLEEITVRWFTAIA